MTLPFILTARLYNVITIDFWFGYREFLLDWNRGILDGNEVRCRWSYRAMPLAQCGGHSVKLATSTMDGEGW